jgi:diamine N-acetyltransferase
MIRDAHIPEELPVIADIIRRSFATVAARYGFTLEGFPNHPAYISDNEVTERVEKGLQFFVYEEAGTLAGVVGIRNKGNGEWTLEKLAVLPAFRSQGVGRRLVAHAAEAAQREGARCIIIVVLDEDDVLKAWYRSQGFRDGDQRRFSHLPVPVRFMERSLEEKV